MAQQCDRRNAANNESVHLLAYSAAGACQGLVTRSLRRCQQSAACRTQHTLASRLSVNVYSSSRDGLSSVASPPLDCFNSQCLCGGERCCLNCFRGGDVGKVAKVCNALVPATNQFQAVWSQGAATHCRPKLTCSQQSQRVYLSLSKQLYHKVCPLQVRSRPPPSHQSRNLHSMHKTVAVSCRV